MKRASTGGNEADGRETMMKGGSRRKRGQKSGTIEQSDTGRVRGGGGRGKGAGLSMEFCGWLIPFTATKNVEPPAASQTLSMREEAAAGGAAVTQSADETKKERDGVRK